VITKNDQTNMVRRDAAILIRERHTSRLVWSHSGGGLDHHAACSYDDQQWECAAARWARHQIAGNLQQSLTAEQIQLVEVEAAALLAERHVPDEEPSSRLGQLCVYDWTTWPCGHAKWAHAILSDASRTPIPVPQRVRRSSGALVRDHGTRC
jgi:hypothetical protein